MRTIVLAGIQHNVMRYTKNKVCIIPSGADQSPIQSGPAFGKTHIERIDAAHRRGIITTTEHDAAVEAVRLEQL